MAETDGAGLSLKGEAVTSDDDARPRLLWTLVNDTGRPVELDCDGYRYCAVEAFRIDALQADGSWEQRDDRAYYEFPSEDTPEGVRVQTGAETLVVQTEDLEPGTYRAIVRVRNEDGVFEVARELAIVGWSAERAEEAAALHAQSEEADCWSVTRRIWDGMLNETEPDHLLELLAEAESDEALEDVRLAMLRRGLFVPELSEEVRSMTPVEVQGFAVALHRYRNDAQLPLRPVVAERVLEPIRDLAHELTYDELRNVESFGEHWPVDAPDALLRRLSEGRETGEVATELVRVIMYARSDLFRPEAARLVEILERRCGGGDGIEPEVCESAIAFFSDPWSFGLGRGWGWSGGCGGAIHLHVGVCNDILGAYTELSEPAPRVVFLGGSVEQAPPEDLTEDELLAEELGQDALAF